MFLLKISLFQRMTAGNVPHKRCIGRLTLAAACYVANLKLGIFMGLSPPSLDWPSQASCTARHQVAAAN